MVCLPTALLTVLVIGNADKITDVSVVQDLTIYQTNKEIYITKRDGDDTCILGVIDKDNGEKEVVRGKVLKETPTSPNQHWRYRK